MVYQLDLLSKIWTQTLLAMEKRLTLSENKMNEVVTKVTEYSRNHQTSDVIKSTTIIKDMDLI